jgi:hypothetical protein
MLQLSLSCSPRVAYTLDIGHSPFFPRANDAIKMVPLPQKGSSTNPPRREQSLIASATNATGLTVDASLILRAGPHAWC